MVTLGVDSEAGGAAALMGCRQSKSADVAAPKAVRHQESANGKRVHINSTRLSETRSVSDADMTSILSQLELLAEERHRLEQTLTRLQAAELKDTVPNVDSLSRARFSRAVGAGEPTAQHARVSMSIPEPSQRKTGARVSIMKPSQRETRRVSALSRLSSFKAKEEPIEEDGSSIRDLTDMVTRGRRRAHTNQRSSEHSADGSPSDDCVTHLPRGGVHVHTKHGAVQFGIPPETIKDPLRLGLETPSIYVVPKERFNLKFGTNTCEMEFPAYWNFFIKGSTTTIVCTSEAASIITNIMDEVLEGPREEYLFTEDEYSAFVDEAIYEARPDHLKEIGYFKARRANGVLCTPRSPAPRVC